jgi:hypothetical protein
MLYLTPRSKKLNIYLKYYSKDIIKEGKMKKFIVPMVVLLLVLAGSMPGFASPLLFDRGLPTQNLNNAAGSNRSNVAWSDWETTGTTVPYYLPGDDFTIGTGGTYYIDKIRVWLVKDADASQLALWAGSQGGTISKIATNPTVTSVTYSNSQTYQGSSGTFRTLYQVDFDFSSPWTITGGQTYQFFVDGPWNLYTTNPDDGYVNPFLHASNKDLSGSTQQGADDVFLWMEMGTNSWPNGVPVTVYTWLSGDGGGTSGWGSGWDKNSDGNIQIYGTPIPGALWLLGSGLLGLGLLGRRRKRG